MCVYGVACVVWCVMYVRLWCGVVRVYICVWYRMCSAVCGACVCVCVRVSGEAKVRVTQNI